MIVNVNGGVISDKEKDAYIRHARQKYPGKTIETLDINLDGEFADLKYTFAKVPFERIRRITGSFGIFISFLLLRIIFWKTFK